MIVSKIFDRYTYLHFAAGIIAYYWGFTFVEWIVFHLFLDIFERTEFGKKVLQFFIRIWPGREQNVLESYYNVLGDSASAALGWGSAYLIDNMLQKAGLYEKKEKELNGLHTLVNNIKYNINTTHQRINNLLGNKDAGKLI